MRLSVAFLLIAAALAAPAAAQTPLLVQIDDYLEIRQHETPSNSHLIATPWRPAERLVEQTYGGEWAVNLVVNEDGAVATAEVDRRHSSPLYHEEVRSAALRLRYTPFERDGRAVRAAITTHFSARPADYTGPADRVFPTDIDLATVRIRLERTGCFGTCPAYQVEITGDGRVSYRGEGDVLIVGHHSWTIPVASVFELLELFRRADYFRLDGYYEVNATDLPTYITALEIGSQRKFVLNYGGGGMGGAVASTTSGGDEGNPMPSIVGVIERVIDRVSGAQAFVHGDEMSISRLRALDWNFRSQQSGVALAHLVSDCNLVVAREFLALGAPLRAPSRWRPEGDFMPVIVLAAHCGDLAFVEELVSRGALRRQRDADAFLTAAVNSGFPALVELALRYSRNLTQGENGGLLNDAVMVYVSEDHPNHARFSEAGVVRLLLQAGAQASIQDPTLGDTPLHNASSPETATMLIEAGADPNARDFRGRTPLFNSYFPEIYPILLSAGADINARGEDGYTAIYVANNPEAIRALALLGADLNDVAPNGKTPVEVVGNAASMQTMLDLGARLPEERERIAAIMARTAYWEWLPPALAEKAASFGLTQPTPR